MTSEKFDGNLSSYFKKYLQRQMSHSFDCIVFLTSISSETSILTKHIFLLTIIKRKKFDQML